MRNKKLLLILEAITSPRWSWAHRDTFRREWYGGNCSSITAQFYNHVEVCGKPPVGVIKQGSIRWPVCAEHKKDFCL